MFEHYTSLRDRYVRNLSFLLRAQRVPRLVEPPTVRHGATGRHIAESIDASYVLVHKYTHTPTHVICSWELRG